MRTRCSSSSPSPRSAKTYTFRVEQTYSDGSIVNWAGSESSAAPAPTIEAADSLGGGWRLGVDDHRAGRRRARAARRRVRAARRSKATQPGHASRARRSGLVLVLVAAALIAAAVARLRARTVIRAVTCWSTRICSPALTPVSRFSSSLSWEGN